jgi:hypothetical protein
MARRTYPIKLVINGVFISEIIIDPHYELKHKASINDELIISLFHSISGSFYEVEDRKSPFSYFAGRWPYQGKSYRAVWLLEDDETYIGVINVYRN